MPNTIKQFLARFRGEPDIAVHERSPFSDEPPGQKETPSDPYLEVRGTTIVSLHHRQESAEEAESRRRKRKRQRHQDDYRRRNSGFFG